MLKIDPAGTGIAVGLKDLWDAKGLIYTFGAKTIAVRYKQSILGALWALSNPIGNVIIFTLVFSKILRVESDQIPYPIFCYCGVVIWNYVSSIVHASTGSLVWNTGIIKRQYFPREVLPMSTVVVSLFDFLVATSGFLVLFIIYKIPVFWTCIYVIPLILIATIFSVGIGLVLSGLNGVYRDVSYIMPIVLQVWMFASPIIYPVSAVPVQYREVYLLVNPIAFLIDGFRNAVLLGKPVPAELLLGNLLISLFVLCIGYLIFKRLEQTFSDLL